MDQTPVDPDQLKTEDVALVRLVGKILVLRAVMKTVGSPLLLTVRDGANIVISLKDVSMKPEIVGIVVRR